VVTYGSVTSLARTLNRRRESRISAAVSLMVVQSGSSSPLCSRTMYSAYQAGQSASRCPVRFSCWPCAASARLRASDKSATDA